MFGLFKKKSKAEQLEAEYSKLMQESFDLSKTNRKLGDEKYAAAQKVMEELEALKKQ